MKMTCNPLKTLDGKNKRCNPVRDIRDKLIRLGLLVQRHFIPSVGVNTDLATGIFPCDVAAVRF